jgi:hypothetical protein
MPRGRTSATRQRSAISPFIPGTLPPAPPDLTDAEQATWEATVAALPSGWLPGECWPLLKAYCQHTRHADDLNAEINGLQAQQAEAEAQQPEAQPLTDRERAKQAKAEAARRRLMLQLMRAHGYQTSRISSLAVKLRLTPSSRSTGDRARDDRKDASSGPEVKPWNDRGARQ